jgi:uncharacterized metal-binding protein YceD (DUF177 family)
VLIQIDKLKRRPRQIAVERQASSFPVFAEMIVSQSVTFDESITGSLEASWVGDYIKVSGRLATLVNSPCCRCLAPVSTRLNVPILLTYVSAEEGEATHDDELELHADEMELINFSGPELDLLPDVEQEMVMALPPQPLCEASCLGLCHSCGCNLNQVSCNCEAPILHPGLAALKNFKV